MFVLLDKDRYVIHPPSYVGGEGWIKISEENIDKLRDFMFIDCVRYIDGELILDEEKQNTYIEEENKNARAREEEDKEHKALVIIQNALLKSSDVALQASSNISDEDAILVEDKIPLWQEGKKYTLNQIVKYNGSLYRVTQQEVTAQGHQQPGSTGMSAVYRPIGKDLPTEELGTMEAPIPFVYEMDVDKGKYYSYQDKVYLAEADMKPCAWYPGTAGLWQWELVK